MKRYSRVLVTLYTIGVMVSSMLVIWFSYLSLFEDQVKWPHTLLAMIALIILGREVEKYGRHNK